MPIAGDLKANDVHGKGAERLVLSRLAAFVVRIFELSAQQGGGSARAEIADLLLIH